MYFKKTTPEEAGISSKTVLSFLKTLDSCGFSTHSILMARGDNLFTEVYYAPFHKDFKHRMYSVSKTFVSMAVGMAIDDGLLSLDDKFMSFFPAFADKADDWMKEATIRDLLRMETSIKCGINWFYTGTDDRTEVYFGKGSDKIPGTIFDYDSPASQMLCAIVENLTGKPFLEYMKEKCLRDIGFSEDAYCLQVPGGHSFGDSGVMCSARDLLHFARLVLNGGTWNGKEYVSGEYVKAATKKQVCNDLYGFTAYDHYGYGYLIWKTPRDGFGFFGMGDQFAICDPTTDFIFVINSDNQGNPTTRPILFHELYKTIVQSLSEPLEKDDEAYEALKQYCATRKLYALPDDGEHALMAKIDGVTYELDENPMGIEWIRFSFKEKKGILSYRNRQGEKKLTFGIGYNEFGKFPEEGYSDLVAGKPASGHYYDVACSADISEEEKLRIKVQVIDKYFGTACFVFSFKDDRVTVNMIKTAEAFLNEYQGLANGKRCDDDEK